MFTYLFVQLQILEKIQSWAINLFCAIDNISEQDEVLIEKIRSDIQREEDYTLNELENCILDNISCRSKLLQHFSYTKFFVNQIGSNPKARLYIKQNTTDILLSDLPFIRTSLKKYYSKSLDTELMNHIEDLLKINKHTEAVQDAFKLLSERIRKSLNMPETCKDGCGLIDAAFSKKYKIQFRTGEYLSEKERKNFSDLLKSVYSLIRNTTAHDFQDISFPTAEMAIVTINYALRTLKI